jgi:cytochrome c oxidase assembly factor CtaG
MSIWADANGWPFPPTILIGCLVAEILYFRGWSVLVKSAQAKQAARTTTSLALAGASKHQRGNWFWRGIFFMGAILMLLLASSAPVDALSSRLFWVHMIQHLLLLVVIAPLFVAAAPFLPLWLGLPRWARTLLKATVKLNVRRACYRLGHWLRQPAIACSLLILGTWVWHWPPLYDLALTNDIIHDWCEHSTFLAVSVLFWTQVIPSPPLYPHVGYLGRMGCVGVAIVQNLILAVLLAFAPLPLYTPYAHLFLAPGQFSALQDQQFGAGIMWTFGDVPFGIAFSVLVQQWLASQPDGPIPETP